MLYNCSLQAFLPKAAELPHDPAPGKKEEKQGVE